MPFFGPLTLSGTTTPNDAWSQILAKFPTANTQTAYPNPRQIGFQIPDAYAPSLSPFDTMSVFGGQDRSGAPMPVASLTPSNTIPMPGYVDPSPISGKIGSKWSPGSEGEILPSIWSGMRPLVASASGGNPSESLTGMISTQGGLLGGGGGGGDSGAGGTPGGTSDAGTAASGSPMGDAGMSPGFSAGFTSPIGSVGQIGMGTFGGQQSSSGLIGQGINAALGIANTGITPGSVANLAMGASPFGLGIANSVLGMVASNISNQNLANTLNTTFTEGAQQGFTPGIYSGLDAGPGPAPGIGIDTGEAGGGNAPGGPTGDASGPTASAAAAGEAGSGESGGPGPGEGDGGGGGGGGGGGSGGSVICTELHRQGYLNGTLWAADEAYGRALDPAIYRGYRRWGGPVASAMQTRPWLARLIWPIARPAIEAMAGRHSWWGDTLLTLGLTVSRRLA